MNIRKFIQIVAVGVWLFGWGTSSRAAWWFPNMPVETAHAKKDIIDFIRHFSELEFGKKPSRIPSGFAGGWFKKLSALYSGAFSAPRLPEKLAHAREKALDCASWGACFLASADTSLAAS